MKRTALAALALAAILTAGAALLLSRDTPPPASEWNVLWIVVDDLKADHLGVAGYGREVTPNIDRLARGGAYFENCVTQAPWSLPSYASMLASKHPAELVTSAEYPRHLRAETDVARSRDPARMPDMNTHWYAPIPPDTPDLASALARRGMKTAAWANNAWLKPKTYNFERHFGHYHYGLAEGKPYTDARDTAALAEEWIGENGGRPWFAFVQLMDPHRPYRRHEGIDYGERFIDLYDAEIEHADRAIGELLRALEESGALSRTVIVVNADHGEGVFENDADFRGHGGGVIPEIVHVPLVIKWPGGPGGRKVSALCQNLDIAPTLLDLLGEKPAPGMRGRSLLRDIETEAAVSDVPAYTSALLSGPERMSAVYQTGDGGLFQGVLVPAYGQFMAYDITGFKKRTPASRARAYEAKKLIDRFYEDTLARVEGTAAREPIAIGDKQRRELEALGYLNP